MPDGEEAIAFIKGDGQYADRARFQFPSYIITDLKMAPGDGFDLLEFIEHHPALSIIPVVMLSGSSDPDDVRNAYLLGASSYFAKPSRPEELTALVQLIHNYWAQCQVPEVDEAGYAVKTESRGKPGQRYTKPERPVGDSS